MAAVAFAHADPRTRKVWANEVQTFALRNMALTPLMGSSPDSIIYVKKDLTRQPGDTIVFQADDEMLGGGEGDDGNNEGKEVATGLRNMSVTIHERSIATRAAGQMSLQRTDVFRAAGFRAFAKRRLGIWWKQAVEDDLCASMSGLYNENSGGADIETINESYPTANRIYYGGQSIGSTPALDTESATDAAMTARTSANNRFGTLVINRIAARACAASPRFRPGSFYQQRADAAGNDDPRNILSMDKVSDLYAFLVHPYQFASLRSEIGTTGFNQMAALCSQRGDSHPIYRMGGVLWYGTIVQPYDRIHIRTGAGGTTLAEGFLLNAGRDATTDACANGRSVARALFLGAQAQCVGWGRMLNWYEGWIDERIPRVVIDWIYGMRRTLFNPHGETVPGAAEDEAIYCVDTEVAE